MVTGKNELTQGGFSERIPGGSQLHQQFCGQWLVAGGWFAIQNRLIFLKAAPQSLKKLTGLSWVEKKDAWLISLHSFSPKPWTKCLGAKGSYMLIPVSLEERGG